MNPENVSDTKEKSAIEVVGTQCYEDKGDLEGEDLEGDLNDVDSNNSTLDEKTFTLTNLSENDITQKFRNNTATKSKFIRSKVKTKRKTQRASKQINRKCSKIKQRKAKKQRKAGVRKSPKK